MGKRKEAIKVLKKANKRIKGRWHKGAIIDHDFGLSKEDPDWADEVPVCILGALNWAVAGSPLGEFTDEQCDVYEFAESVLESVVEQQTNNTLVGYNDRPTTTEKDIRNMIKLAIERLEK